MSKLNILCGHNLTFNDWDETHGVEQTLRLARYVGADIDKPHLVYEIKKEESEAFETRAKTEFALSDKPRIVLQLGGGRRASWRDWPIERYAELIFLLRQNLEDVDIIVLGGRDHEHRRRELALKAPPKSYVDCVGKLSIRESAALLASARVVVSTDTGMMHLGFAVGTRVVALIHCNNPANRVGPYGYGDRHRVVQLARPAGYQKPSDANMADISAHEVLSATLDLYRSREREG
jgi:ADP-heptose:LPS heptosyltransferase